MSAALLVAVLLEPGEALRLDARHWTGLLAAARGERLIGTLAAKLDGLDVPPDVAAILADARLDNLRERRQALWEVDRALAALAPLDCPVVLLKGSAFIAAGLLAGQGRAIGDLDILVPRERLDEVEAALLSAGWEWVKPDPYDDIYYRRWMHELPPLIHHDRDRMIDVHHTILPLTARPRPDAAAMIADAVPLEGGGAVLRIDDMLCHAAAHLLADGDMAGGLRNLWDIHCLILEHGEAPNFWLALDRRARQHGLTGPMRRAVRLSHRIFGTEAPAAWLKGAVFDALFEARLLTRNDWGLEERPFLRLAFYIRSHWLRMPPLMLARHLWTKWRKGYRPVGP
ncbi:nucleotidyltransferase domain-containing protein [Sphingobium nicotianae]|uniref:Nucleotidyltransferase family protein n=1 Tax=Sphingobium nicotianae TaxID=2782607 RepID=A0A9X1DDX2_9SPHN|nr:nucleotidyltransferase family protein [Sphingobium nicotianae]MBT2188089.1 nucleotidyltransferase family protein [Sphingobium nicotianae]